MSNSPLATYRLISPNRTSPRNHEIDTITIHCFVGQVTAERGCEVFQPSSKQASCNYVVGYDGSIGLCVEEKDRSWCSGGKDEKGNVIRVNGISGADNDHRAITIEVASDSTEPYAVTGRAYDALIQLVADICKRNGIKRLLWQGNKNLVGDVRRQNMTVHRWFALKSCPGDYLYERHGDIAKKVNNILEEDLDMTKDELLSCDGTGDNPSDWAKEGTEFCKEHGIFAGDGNGNYGWQQPITREAVACVIQRALEAAKEM